MQKHIDFDKVRTFENPYPYLEPHEVPKHRIEAKRQAFLEEMLLHLTPAQRRWLMRPPSTRRNWRELRPVLLEEYKNGKTPTELAREYACKREQMCWQLKKAKAEAATQK